MARVRKITTMAELNAALMAAFNAINRDFYANELEKVIITVKEGKRKNAYGWIESQKHWNQNGKERHEINISVDYIGERTVVQTITTLMHEMAHLYNTQNGIKDTTRGGTYHNKRFKESAEAHGLVCEPNEHIGWAHTTPTPETREWIEKNIPIKSFRVYKQIAEKEPNESKPKQSMRKLVCPLCGNAARVTKDISILCGECSSEEKLVQMIEEV